MDFIGPGMLLDQYESDVFFHRLRVEQCTLLEDDSDFPSQAKQFVFIKRRDFFSEDEDSSCVRFHQSQREFQDSALARSSDAEEHFGFTAVKFERDSLQDLFAFKSNGNVFESKHNLFGKSVGRRSVCVLGTWRRKLVSHYAAFVPRTTIRNRVISTSTVRIRTDDATTACVVERPTPWVPPVVERP